MSKQLNHSRYIDINAKDIGDNAYRQAKSTPSVKQVKFFKQLFAMCKEHGVDTDTGEYVRTRSQYGMAIDKLLERLQIAGVDVNGNGKKASYVLTAEEDRRGRLNTEESIKLKDAPWRYKRI